MYFVFYKILYEIHVQNFAIAKNFSNMVQTWAWLMFNKIKQDCCDIKATAIWQSISMKNHYLSSSTE